jgi:hypothetical protein
MTYHIDRYMKPPKPPPHQPVTNFRLTPGMAEQRVRATAKDSDNVIFSEHALERMEERGFDDIQVLEILRTGMVTEQPTLTEFKEWKCKIEKKLRGGREAGAVVIILQNAKLFIKTVEWEDL